MYVQAVTGALLMLQPGPQTTVCKDVPASSQRCAVLTALSHERQFAVEGHPGQALAAASAWVTAGENALAVDILRELDTRGPLPVELQKQHKSMQEQLSSQVREVTFVVMGARTPQRIEVHRHRSQRARPLQRELAPDDNGRASVHTHLDPGTWTVRVFDAGSQRLEQVVDVGPGPGPARYLLRPEPDVSGQLVNMLIQRSPAMARRPLTVVARGSDGTESTCVVPKHRDSCVLALHQASWQLELRAPEHRPQVVSVMAKYPAGQPLVVELEPLPKLRETRIHNPNSSASPAVRGLAISAGTTALVGTTLAITGEVLNARRASTVRQHIAMGSCNTSDPAGYTCQASLITPMHVRATGFGLLGGSIGLATSALYLRGRKSSNRVSIPLLSAGVATSVAASLWLGLRTKPTDQAFSRLGLDDVAFGGVTRIARERVFAGGLLGIGLGLVAGGLLAIIPRRGGRLAVEPMGRGIAVRGVF